MNRQKSLYLAQAGLIAALYTVLTLLSSLFGLSSGVLQVRFSEALCILPIFLPAAVPGLTVGCLLSNFLTGALWQDVLFGSLATLAGAFGALLLRKHPLLAPLPTVLSNTLVLPFVLSEVYHAEQALPVLFFFVGVGELLSAYLLGLLLYSVLKRYGSAFKFN